MIHKHIPYKSKAARKKDLTLLICLLRLRILPAIPYPQIASLLLSTWPGPILRLLEQICPREIRVKFVTEEDIEGESKRREWLADYLEERYELVEEWESEPWVLALNMDEGVVEGIFRDSKLRRGSEGEEYKVMSDEEMRVQNHWRQEGDWRAGSLPESRGESLSERYSRPVGYRSPETMKEGNERGKAEDIDDNDRS